jgi:DNA repair exonuclease SbcCD ATPase subunit
MEVVASKVFANGGIAIAAHIDGKNGFRESVDVGQTRITIHDHEHIEALELIDATKKDDWTGGKIYPKPRACIQGSDAHTLRGIGSCPTWVRVGKLSVEGLRQAFRDPEPRIRFINEFAGEPVTYIERLTVSQGFLGKLDIEFNPGLNCLVGGQGVGKSAIIEFIRFCLNDISNVPSIFQDHESKIKHLLGNGGKVAVTIRNSDGTSFVVTREFDDNVNPTTIQKLLDDGTTEDYPIPDISRYFSVLAYSQGEAAIVARDSIKQLELIDGHLDLSSENEKLNELADELDRNTTNLQYLDSKSGDVDDLQSQKIALSKEMSELEDKIKAIEESKNEPALRDHQSWQDEQAYLKGITDGLETLKQEFKRLLDHLLKEETIRKIEKDIPKTNLGNDDELQSAREEASQARSYLENLSNQVENDLQNILTRTRDAAPLWIKGWNQHQKEYKETIDRLGNLKIKAFQSQLTRKKTELIKINEQLENASLRQKQKQELMESRISLINQIERERKRITTKRMKQAKDISKLLQNRISLNILPDDNKDSFFKWLSTNVKSRYIQQRHIDQIVSALTPRQLADLIRKSDQKALIEKTTLSPSVIENLVGYFRKHSEKVYELEHILLEDSPDIRMRVKGVQEFRRLELLSTGQKFTVIILLALTEDIRPIIYDQPEDALDTALIYSDIAQILRKSKENRQFIFATHNSNMSVAADLDLAIILEGNATQSEVTKAGGLDEGEVRKLLITYLEGGSEALQQRVRKLSP